MKNALISIALCLVLALSAAGCGDNYEANGQEYETKGLLTREERDPCVRYRVVVGNCIWGVLLAGTVIAPIYFYGFSMYEGYDTKANCPATK